MKTNIWKILTAVFIIICIIEFIWAFSYIKNKESETTIEIAKLRMKITQDSLEFNKNKANKEERGILD